MAVRMYTVYRDLAGDPDPQSASRLQALQTARDRALYNIFVKKNIPAFPMNKSTFEKHRKEFENISTKNKLLCFLFDCDGKCVVLNDGSYTEYESVLDAQHAIYGVNDGSNVLHIVNKYRVDDD